VCLRRWSRSMATFSGTLKRFRVFLDMGKLSLEIVAYSSALFFPFRLKQNTITATTLLVVPRSMPMIFSPSATANPLSGLHP
jgi:hypothetical protein